MQQTVYTPAKHFYMAPKEFDDQDDAASEADTEMDGNVKIE
jgi:hypothetical protein